VVSLGLAAGQGLQGPGVGVHPVHVPPASPVGDHVQHPVGPPLGLKKRLAPGGHASGTGQVAPLGVGNQVGHPQLGVVPRQVGVVPTNPGQAGSVRGDPGPGHEVGTGGDHVDPHRPVGGHGHQLVGRLATCRVDRVGFANAHVPATVRRGPPVCVAQGPRGVGLRSQQHGTTVRRPTHQPLVGPVGVDEDAVGHPPGPPAVLVDTGPHIDAWRDHVGRCAVGRTPDHHGPPTLLGPALGPPDIPTVDHHLG